MSSNDPGVPAYRFMVSDVGLCRGIYNLQLEEAVDQFQEDQVDSHTRRQFEDASEENRVLWADHIADGTSVLTSRRSGECPRRATPCSTLRHSCGNAPWPCKIWELGFRKSGIRNLFGYYGTSTSTGSGGQW